MNKYSTPKKYVKPLCQKEEDLYAHQTHQKLPRKYAQDQHIILAKKDVKTPHQISASKCADFGASDTHKNKYGLSIHHTSYKTDAQALRIACVNFLNTFNWDWFTTLTFRDLPGTYTAKNRAIRWLKTLQRQERRKVGYYMVMEFTVLGSPHLHLLMGNLDGVRRDKYWKLWFEKNGRVRILPFEKNRSVGYYLTKYIIKDEYVNFGTWEIGNLELLRQQFLPGT